MTSASLPSPADTAALLQPAFQDPVLDAQRSFRAALKALAEPGLVRNLDRAPALAALQPASYALCLSFLDSDTPLWLAPGLDSPTLRANLAFHCGCPIVAEREQALFALLDEGELDDLSGFDSGSDRYPDQSCTLLIQLAGLDGGASLEWRGPGIAEVRQVALPVSAGFWAQRAARTEFPRGLDAFFAAGERILGLPRSTRVSEPSRRWPDVRSRQGWREGHRQRPSPAGAQAPRRYRAAGAVGGADPPADAAGRVAGDDRGFAVRRATGGTGDQAGGRRPDGSDLPSPRLPHHAAALRRQPAAGHRRDASATTYLATYKDLPGGQLLGPTFDYTHRLLDFSLLAEGDYPGPEVERGASLEPCPRVLGLLDREGLMTPEYELPGAVPDITREPLDFPTGRAQRLQALARGDEGFLLALGYSTQRGYGRNHPFAGEIRIGACEVWLEPEELGFAVPVGEIEVTECEMVNQFVGSREELPQFTRGYGLAFGYAERKAMGMALVDRACAPRNTARRWCRRRSRKSSS